MPNLFISHCSSSNVSNLDNLHQAIEYYEYRLFPKEILKAARNILNKSEKDCWEYLFEECVFDENKIVRTTRQKIATAIRRSKKTVGRLLDALEEAGFLIKVRRNRFLELHVRAPAKILEEMFKKKPRSKPVKTNAKNVQKDINVHSGRGRSYYLYNTNNNNTDCTTVPAKKIESEIVVPAAQKIEEPSVETEQTIQAKKEPKVDSAARIEKLEIRKKDIATEFTKAMIEKNYQKMRELGDIETSINLEIDRLKFIPPTSKKINANFTRRKISEIEWNKIHKEINSYNLNINIQRLMEEIDFSVRQGSLRFSKFNRNIENTVEHAWNIGLQLIREGKWQTPREMFRR